MRVTVGRDSLLIGSAAVAGGLIPLLWHRPLLDLREKVVLITGGSRGLGLALARGFASRGAYLSLAARNPEELDTAKQDLCGVAKEMITVPCDVSDKGQVAHLLDLTLQRYGRIDVLVNNAGIIHVGPVETMAIEDFERAMNVMFWGVVHTTLGVLPHMRRRGEGRIVNITSIGAKVSVPHLVPYSCAKFAAAAFSEGLRAELQGTGIRVVTIAPGLMRTGSYLNAVFKGSAEGEAAWFSLGASLPGISMSAERAAEQIISATRKGTAERILGVPANMLARFHGLFPGATTGILGVVNRLLPHGGNDTLVGTESQVLQKPWMRALTVLGRSAADQLQPHAVRQSGI